MAKILIIDDDIGVRESYSTFLKLEGFETVVAETGATGIALTEHTTFDAILVDLRLPDMSGVAVLKELAARSVTCPMVMITAFPDIESAFDAATVGAAGFVEGPLWGEEIVSVVYQALERRMPVRLPNRRQRSHLEAESDSTLRGMSGSGRVDPRTQQVLGMVERDPTTAACVKALADQIGLSESRLRHLFAAHMNSSLSKYLRHRRLHLAARQLQMTSNSLPAIANMAGWGDLRRFRAAFVHLFGMGPHAYRSRFGHPTGPTEPRKQQQ